MTDTKIYGARASVLIRFDGTLTALAEKLSGALRISGFDIEPDEYPPHEEIGMTGTLGWELWLNAAESRAGVFELCIRTTTVSDEISSGRMHDLSPWLAQLLAIKCKWEVWPAETDSPPPSAAD